MGWGNNRQHRIVAVGYQHYVLRLGFALFLISNGFWIAFGLRRKAPGLVAMQLVFTATSAVGVYRWLIGPALLGL